MSAETAYKKVLDTFFIILLIILIGIAIYVVYKFISAKIINNNSDEFISEFTNEIGDTEGNIITDETTQTDSDTDSAKSSKASKVKSARSSTSKKSANKYYGFDICGYIRIPKTGYNIQL